MPGLKTNLYLTNRVALKPFSKLHRHVPPHILVLFCNMETCPHSGLDPLFQKEQVKGQTLWYIPIRRMRLFFTNGVP